jgi:hypothetical protein
MKRSVREDWEFLRREWKFFLLAPPLILMLVGLTHTGKDGVYVFSVLALVYRTLREVWRDQRQAAKARSGGARSTGSR